MPFIINLQVELDWVITLTIPQFSHILTLFTFRDITMSDEILTIQELAEYLKLNEKTAYRLAGEGKLPGFKVGGSWRFKREDVLVWIEEQKDNK
jgi:excisionase family DNA binding protein